MMIAKRIEIVKLLPENSIVAEIGVAEGRFSAELLSAGVGQLLMVDNWGHISGVTGDGNFSQEWHDKNYRTALNSVEQWFPDRAKILRGMSSEMASRVSDNYLDAIYLDAGHYYKAVMEDLNAWYPKVKSGGIISGHDYLCEDYDVKRAVLDFLFHKRIKKEENQRFST
mgnify:CR=1 FL=1